MAKKSENRNSPIPAAEALCVSTTALVEKWPIRESQQQSDINCLKESIIHFTA